MISFFICVVAFFLLVAFILSIKLLVRGWILCIRLGHKYSFSKYTVSLILALPLLAFETGNLVGFSWKELRILKKEEIIDAAVRYSYPNIYSNLAEMKKDYSKFDPEVRYWGSWSINVENGLLEKLFGLTRYQVRMPEAIVMVTIDSEADFSRSDDMCGDSVCPFSPPNIPEQGIIGTVQLNSSSDNESDSFSIVWSSNTKGSYVKQHDHCFSAYNKSSSLNKLLIDTKSGKISQVETGYGFYLMTLKDDGFYGIQRISKDQFLKSSHCDEKN